MQSVKITASRRRLVRLIERRGVVSRCGAYERDLQVARARNHRSGARQLTPDRPPRSLLTTRARRPCRPIAASRKTVAPVPSGEPLGKNEIITMLQGGVPAARVEQFVEARGVNFNVTPEIAREINAAGGNRSLIGAITEKATQAAANDGSPFQPAEAAATGPDYDDYIDRIQSSISANDPNSVIRYAQQAIQLSPEQPTAYSLLGTTLLYLKRKRDASRRCAPWSATERRLHLHDHKGRSPVLRISFFVTMTGVSSSHNGLATFEPKTSTSRGQEQNAIMGAQTGLSHQTQRRLRQENSTSPRHKVSPSQTLTGSSRILEAKGVKGNGGKAEVSPYLLLLPSFSPRAAGFLSPPKCYIIFLQQARTACNWTKLSLTKTHLRSESQTEGPHRTDPERRADGGRLRAAQDSARSPARGLGADGHEARLRAGRVRDVRRAR